MIAHILQEGFLRTLTRAGRIVPLRPPLPILQNVKLTATEGGVEVAVSNLETTEIVWVGGKVEKAGELCVSARVLLELVTSFPAETVKLASQEGALRVSCTGFSAVLPGVPAAEFPPLPEIGGKKKISTEKSVLMSALAGVLFAAATDEGRPLLTGIKIAEGEKGMVFAATDGYRLSVKTVAPPLPSLGGMVIPARTLFEVVKIAQEEKDEKEVAFGPAGDNQVGFDIGDTQIITRLLEGDYPDFARIIPKTHTTRVLLDKEQFDRAVRSAAIFARDNANIVRFSLGPQRLVVSANAPQVGENRVEVEAKIDGEGGEIAFNSRFLLEFLANFPEEEFLFEMTGSLNPGVFRPVKDDSYLHIIMPVRVQG